LVGLVECNDFLFGIAYLVEYEDEKIKAKHSPRYAAGGHHFDGEGK